MNARGVMFNLALKVSVSLEKLREVTLIGVVLT